MRSAIVGSLVAVVGWLGLTGPAAGKEMIANGTFDASLSGWGGCCSGSGTTTFDASRDASGSALSGSAQLVHTDPPDEFGASVLFLSQCLTGAAVKPGTSYFLGGRFRFLEGEAAEGEVTLVLEFRASTDCTGSNLSGAGAGDELASAGRGVWRKVAIGSKAAGATAPAGAKSARLTLGVWMTSGTKLTVNLDDIFLAPVGTPVCAGMPATIIGTALPETLPGTAASDVIVGLGGADQIDAKGGNDRVCGGAGADTVFGGTGDDRLTGGAGADHLYGGPDHDRLIGGKGNDFLYGEAGVDEMKGGAGSDSCDGGPGAVDLATACEVATSVP